MMNDSADMFLHHCFLKHLPICAGTFCSAEGSFSKFIDKAFLYSYFCFLRNSSEDDTLDNNLAIIYTATLIFTSEIKHITRSVCINNRMQILHMIIKLEANYSLITKQFQLYQILPLGQRLRVKLLQGQNVLFKRVDNCKQMYYEKLKKTLGLSNGNAM